MTRPLPLALVQTAAESIEQFAISFPREVAANPVADLFVYPELFLTSPDDSVTDRAAYVDDIAEPLDGPRGKVLAELAGDLKVWLVPGSVFERGADGRV